MIANTLAVLAIAASGIFLIVGTRKLAVRVFAVGIILAAAGAILSTPAKPERSYVADR